MLADLGGAPAVNGDVKLGARVERGHEAGHGWHAKGASGVAKLCIWNHMTVNLELLERDTSIADFACGEQQNVPVVVTHNGGQKQQLGRRDRG